LVSVIFSNSKSNKVFKQHDIFSKNSDYPTDFLSDQILWL